MRSSFCALTLLLLTPWLAATGCSSGSNANGTGTAGKGGAAGGAGSGGGVAGTGGASAGSGGSGGGGATGAGGAGTCGDTQSNPANCGACGHDCLGGECNAGKCQPVMLGMIGAGSLHEICLDATHVYLIVRNGGSGGVVRVAKTGGALEPIASNLVGNVMDVAADGGDVFWALDHPGSTGEVWKAKADGTMPLLLAGNISVPSLLSADASGVYVASGLTPQQIWSVARAGGATPLLAANSHGIAVGGGHVYFTVYASGTVNRVPIAGGTAEPLVMSQTQPERLVLDATNMYWLNNGGTREVVKAARDGSGMLVLASFQANLFDVAVDATHVYWSSGTGNNNDGAIQRVAIGGGAASSVRSGGIPFSIAVDASAIYWTDTKPGFAGGTIMKLAK